MRENRLADLEAFMQENTRASIDELCANFHVSVNTIRRDIAELVQRGTISKVYGGIVLREENEVVPFQDRKNRYRKEKVAIGERAASLVQDGNTIYIDSGTTAPLILPYLKTVREVTVLSNSQIVYAAAAKYTNLQFISPGGLYNTPTNSFVGSSTVSALQLFQITTAFMAATAFSLNGGAMNNSYHEAEVKKAVISRAQQVVLMLDHSKVDQQAGISFCPIDALDYLVSDQVLPDEYQARLNNLHIKMLI